MWQTNILYKTVRTDGGVAIGVEFSDGTRKFTKEYTFFNDFNLGDVIANDIVSLTKLYSTFDGLSIGVLVPPEKKAPVVDTLAADIGKLRRLQQAVDLGLLKADDTTLTDQIDQIKANPDFLSLI